MAKVDGHIITRNLGVNRSYKIEDDTIIFEYDNDIAILYLSEIDQLLKDIEEYNG